MMFEDQHFNVLRPCEQHCPAKSTPREMWNSKPIHLTSCDMWLQRRLLGFLSAHIETFLWRQVLSMDISSDSTLLASGSADKNLKIWGLDFGDCHRSLFAHGDSLMAVAFQPNTHYVFTAGA